jgi:hypothetical protein
VVLLSSSLYLAILNSRGDAGNSLADFQKSESN